MHVKLGELSRLKELEGVQERNLLHRSKRNGSWLSAVPHRLNSTEFFREEFWDNLCLRYGLMPQDIPATCDGCGKKLSIEHALSFPKGGLVIAQNYEAAKDWGSLGAWSLVPSYVAYKPNINSRTVQGERTGDGAHQDNGTADGGADTVGESQGCRGRAVNGADILVVTLGRVEVTADSRADVSSHGF